VFAGSVPVYIWAVGTVDWQARVMGNRRRRIPSWEFSVKLPGGGEVVVRLEADNPFSLTPDDRTFVFDLVDRLKAAAREFGTDFTTSTPSSRRRSIGRLPQGRGTAPSRR
jgi:hypothetical protein